MHFIDLGVFVVYMLAMLGVGFYFLRRNQSTDDYYVGGRKMGSWHIGLSVVATDVGGGFSIGLGGLGFTMGLSGSWMLFTGLIGAWLSAALLIPKVSELSRKLKWLTFPQMFEHFYSARVALLAGIISAIGYIGFTASQILAGAKLAAASFEGLSLEMALLVMGIIAIGYTVMGGMQAVIYTDTIQWIILMGGLVFIGIPLGYTAVGGWDQIQASLAPEMLSLQNISWQVFVNWAVTIIPIWFVGMTLYQRIYATRSTREARKAWFIAGLFEYPVMAFMGVLLGLFAKVGFEQGLFSSLGYAAGTQLDPEMGLPMLLRQVLPVGLMGLMLSAYFSAIMSTADSCLMAASGNVLTDILGRFRTFSDKGVLRISQLLTLLIGSLALLLASAMQNVLGMMLYSYAFMVSGLFIPVMGALFWPRASALAAFWAMLTGGSLTLALILLELKMPYNLDPIVFGMLASLLVFVALCLMFPAPAPHKTQEQKVY